MAVISDDIKMYLSGGSANSDPDASIGGALSTTEITSDELNNLFDDIGVGEALSGDIDYRCFYIKNTHGTDNLLQTEVHIESNTDSVDTTIAIALDESSEAQAIADEHTAPVAASNSAIEETDLTNTVSWKGAVWADELALWVIAGGDGIATSPDGVTWTSQTNPGAASHYGVVWSPSLELLAAINNSEAGQRITTSPDGINWTPQTTPNDYNFVTAPVWADFLGMFIAGNATTGTVNRFIRSTDGETWTAYESNNQIIQALGVSESQELVVAAGAGLSYVTSNGTSWTARNSPSSDNVLCVYFSEIANLWLIGDLGGRILSSPDASNASWTQRMIDGTIDILSIKDHTDGYIYAMGSQSNISKLFKSSDGLTWEEDVSWPSGSERIQFIGSSAQQKSLVFSGLTGTNALAYKPGLLEFSSPATAEDGLDIGTLGPGEAVPVWVRRTTSADAAGAANDPFTLRLGGVPE